MIFAVMGNDYDPQHQAEAAMREAVNATGLERFRWIQVAQAWLELARIRPGADGIPARSCWSVPTAILSRWRTLKGVG